MKYIVITGSSGLVGTELIHNLLQRDEFFIIALTTSLASMKERYAGVENIICMDLNQFSQDLHNYPLSALIHCGFSRSASGNKIASSLQYIEKLLATVKGSSLKTFVNISSQSVYGQSSPPLWKEEIPVDPDYLYAMGKFSSELIVNGMLADTSINYTNIRLASVNENARFLQVFVKNAITGIPIKVLGGAQSVSLIDVRDVANALEKVIDNCDHPFSKIYNLGTGQTRTILELAKDVKRLYESENKDVVINVEDSDIVLNVGMDSIKFQSEFNWTPEYDYDDMIKSLLNYNLNVHDNEGKIGIKYDIFIL